MDEYKSLAVEAAVVAGSALASGYLFKTVHNYIHQTYGVSSAIILGLSVLLGGMAVGGYYLWTVLTEVQYNQVIAGLTFTGMAGIHYLSHGYLPSFQAVGGAVFFTAAIGTVLNYVLRPDGIEL